MVKIKKLLPAALITSTLLISLTGCQDVESFYAYVDSIDALDGIIASGGSSQPLPGSVSGSLYLEVEPSHLTYQKALDAACNTPVNATVSLNINVKTESNSTQADLYGNCEKPIINLVTLNEALAATNIKNITTQISHSESISISSTVENEKITMPDSFTLFKTIVSLLPTDTNIDLSNGNGLHIEGITQTKLIQYLPALEASVAGMETTQVVLKPDSLFIQLPETASVEQAALLRENIKQSLPTYASTVQINISNGVNVTSKVPEEIITLTNYAKATGIPYSITANKDSAQMTVDDISKIVPLSSLITKNNPANIPVLITYYNKNKPDMVYLQIESAHQVNATKNDYVSIMDKYNELAETGKVSFINFDSNGLAVKLNDRTSVKGSDWNQIAALLHKYDKDEYYGFISINGKTID